MRIIGSIPHPVYKITLFKTDSRFAIKLENGTLEQTYKVRIAAQMSNINDLRKIVDEDFLLRVGGIFKEMAETLNAVNKAQTPSSSDDEFDVII